ncbi:HAD hydrolase-like protein [Ancylomarina sp. YFZ004]
MIITRKPELVIFDFDGCIVDSTSDAINFLYQSIEEKTKKIDRSIISDCLQGTFDETIDCVLKKYPKESIELLNPHIREIVHLTNTAKLRNKKESRLFPLIPMLLELLFNDGVKMGVLSRTNKDRIIHNLEYYKLLRYFDCNLIYGEDNLPDGCNPKPSPDGLNVIIKEARIENDECVYFFGDHENDFQAAKAANIHFIASSWAENCFFESNVVQAKTLLDLFIFGIINQIIPSSQELFEKIQLKKLSIFIGAGFSMEAGLDDWSSLVQKFSPENDIPNGDLPLLIQRYIDKNPQLGKNRIFDYIRKSFSKYDSPPKKHILLASLNLNRIWTTNYDSLIEDSYAYSPEIIVNDSDLSPFEKRTQIVKINGSINSVNTSDLVLSTQSFYELSKKKEELFKELNNELLRRSFLFIGTSFSDDISKKILEEFHNSNRNKPVHYVLTTNEIEISKNYISQIIIPEWSTIEDIFQEWNWKLKQRTIVISGAFVGQLDDDEIKYLKYLGAFLLEAGFIIKIGNGVGVVNHILEGALEYCRESNQSKLHRTNILRYNRVLNEDDFIVENKLKIDAKDRISRLIQPVGTTVFIDSNSNGTDKYSAMRDALFLNSDICLAIGGYINSKDTDIKQSDFAKGMMQERFIFNNNKTYLPSPFIKGVAQETYLEYKKTDFISFNNNLKLKDVFYRLESIKDPIDAARLTVASAILASINN